MSSPRHLWSGDWELDSSAAREELAARRAQNDAPTESQPEPQPEPAARPAAPARATPRLRTLIARLVARERLAARAPLGWQLRMALLIALGILVVAGAAYGVTALLAGSGGASSASANEAHSWLGIDVVGSPLGIMVTDVVPGSPAQAAGIEPGDLINQIDGQPVGTVDGVSAALKDLHPGDTINIQLSRGLLSYTTQATLTARPASSP